MTAFEPQIEIDGTAPNSNPQSSPNASDFADQPATGKTWKLLKMKHPTYDQRVLDARKERLLYQGGFRMNQPEIAKLFCPKMKSEEDQSTYNERVSSAAYMPIFSKLTTGLISNLFSQELSVMEAADHDDDSTSGDAIDSPARDFYKRFAANCDGHGTTLHNFIKDRSTCALIHSYCYFGVDYAKEQAANRLEQERLGLDIPRLYTIDIEAVYDWQFQEGSEEEYNWIKLVDVRPFQATPFDPPMQQYIVKTWSRNEAGEATWQCFQSQPVPLGKEPKDKDVLQLVEEGTTSFQRIGIFYFCFDEGVAVGAKLAPMAAERFNRTTIENHSTNRACLTVPVVYRGEMMPSGDGLPDPIMSNSQRGNHPRGKVNSKGVVELGTYSQDRFEIVEAEGKALSFIHKQNEDLEEKMHSVIHQMGQSLKQANSTSGKSGLSKQEDRHAMEMLLTSIADEVYSQVQSVFNTIATSRGEDINWDVGGLSSQGQDDRTELSAELKIVGLDSIPSETFRKEYAFRIASRLIDGTDQRTLQTIRKEIEAGTSEVLDHAQALKEQALQPKPEEASTDA